VESTIKKQLLSLLNQYDFPCQLSSPVRVLLWSNDEESKAAAKEQMFAALLQLEDALAKCSNGKSFFGGDIMGLVDITLGSCLRWLEAIGTIEGINVLDKTKTPRLVEWAELFCSGDPAKEVLPEAEKLVEYYRKDFVVRRVAAASDPPK
ncbi:probable glutathione S-transferase GSTU6, partial [Phalaenopsis equestris]|uniref:probable glutathione S-transferase GSTU6 n=1 Tax=Phalaenopsis equestris TaxID=78828 RepID=UPI0009E39473